MDWINAILPLVTTFIGAFLGYLGTKHTADKDAENQKLKFNIELEKQKNELERIRNEKNIKIAELENQIKVIQEQAKSDISVHQNKELMSMLGPLFSQAVAPHMDELIQKAMKDDE